MNSSNGDYDYYAEVEGLVDEMIMSDTNAILDDIQEETSYGESENSPSPGAFRPVEMPSFFIPPSKPGSQDHTPPSPSRLKKYQDLCDRVEEDIENQVQEDLDFDDDSSEEEEGVVSGGYHEQVGGQEDYEDGTFEEMSYYSDEDENEEDAEYHEQPPEESSSNSWMWGPVAITAYQAQTVHSGSDSSGDRDQEQRTSPSTVEESIHSGSNGDGSEPRKTTKMNKTKKKRKGEKKKADKKKKKAIPMEEDSPDEDIEQSSSPWEAKKPDSRRLVSGSNDSDSSSTALRLRQKFASERSRDSSQRSKDRTNTSVTSTSGAYEVPWLQEGQAEQERLLLQQDKDTEWSDYSGETKCHGMCLRHSNGKWYTSLGLAVLGHAIWCLVVAFLLCIILASDENDDKSLRLPPSSTPDLPVETPAPSSQATLAPTGASTLSPSKPLEDPIVPREPDARCFEDRAELALALEGIFGPNQALVQEEYGILSEWCVSQVTDFSELFAGYDSFNDDLSGWDLSHAVTLRGMFRDAVVFNQPLFWNTSSVSDMTDMFAGATNFDQSLNHWNVRSVQSMEGMFAGAVGFNGGIDGWDTSSVTNMSRMFSRAFRFDRNLAAWNVSSVIDMTEMFQTAIRFQGNGLSAWNVERVERFPRMFQTASSFSEILCAWGPLILVNKMPRNG